MLPPVKHSGNGTRRLEERPWSWHPYVKNHLEEGDHLLICKHYWQNRERGGFLHFVTAGPMKRHDGTTGDVKFTLFCDECREDKRGLKELDFHEWVWIDKKVWLADSLGTANGPPGFRSSFAGGKTA